MSFNEAGKQAIVNDGALGEGDFVHDYYLIGAGAVFWLFDALASSNLFFVGAKESAGSVCNTRTKPRNPGVNDVFNTRTKVRNPVLFTAHGD